MWWYSRYSASSPVPLVVCTSDLPGAYAVRRNRHPFALHSGHITEPWPLRFGQYSSGLITTGTSNEDVVGLHPSDHNIWGQEPGPSCSPGGRTRYPRQPSAGEPRDGLRTREDALRAVLPAGPDLQIDRETAGTRDMIPRLDLDVSVGLDDVIRARQLTMTAWRHAASVLRPNNALSPPAAEGAGNPVHVSLRLLALRHGCARAAGACAVAR
jgi:hypothetical protein